MDQRLRSEQRVRSRQIFSLLFKKGNYVRGRFLNLWSYCSETTKKISKRPQIAVIVSRKTSLKANRRNLWKRRIREVFRKKQNSILPGTAVLIQSKKGAELPSYQVLEAEISELLKKSGIINED